MTKTLTQGFISIALFFAVWFALQQVNWVKIFRVQEATDKTEQKLGDLFWKIYQQSEKELKHPLVVNSIDSIVSKICEANNIDKEKIKIHILDKDEVNAFALPDGHLIVYSGLIAGADNAEELTGVICHELAHIQRNHVMKKLMKEIGLSVLISMTTNGNSEIARETARKLSSSAFDRSLEKEADLKAVDYLVAANVNPGPFADFLYKIADQQPDEARYLTWISTHPDSKERAAYIVDYSADMKKKFEPVLPAADWTKLREKINE